VLPAQTIIPPSDVLSSVASSYTRLGVTVVETPVGAFVGEDTARGTAVVAADLGIVECLLPDDAEPSALGPGIAAMASAGWEVTLLVPAARLGEAHRSLRGMPVTLQPWWLDPAHGICFGASEVP
jgi:hypothetical protein